MIVDMDKLRDEPTIENLLEYLSTDRNPNIYAAMSAAMKIQEATRNASTPESYTSTLDPKKSGTSE